VRNQRHKNKDVFCKIRSQLWGTIQSPVGAAFSSRFICAHKLASYLCKKTSLFLMSLVPARL